MPKLSLCLIVKNEERFLPGCLASVEGVVDELIVVDTGSTDATVAIALAAGATVVHHPWTDDFADARNRAMRESTGDWILMLDADERLAPTAGEAVRQSILDPHLDCGLLPLFNASRLDADSQEVLAGTARNGSPVLLPRLLRKTEDLQWKGVVHENVGEWLSTRQDRIRSVIAPIIHYGAVESLRVELKKDERNLRLLEKRILEEPNNPVALGYLAVEYVRTDQISKANTLQERAWQATHDAMKSDGLKPTHIALSTLRTQLQLAYGRYDDALKTLDQADEWGAPHPNIHFFRGRTYEQQAYSLPEGDARLAALIHSAKAYIAAIDLHEKIFVEEVQAGATTWLGNLRLGTVLLQVGECETALDCFDATLQLKPNLSEALLGRAEALIDQHQMDDVLSIIEPLLKEERPDGWLLAADACFRGGLIADMQRFFEAAKGKGDFYCSHRRILYNRLVHLCSLFTESPIAGSGFWGRVGALAARVSAQDERRAFSGEFPVEMAQLMALNLVNEGKLEVLESLFEERADELLPGLRDTLSQALSTLGMNVEEDGEPALTFIIGSQRSGRSLLHALLSAHPRFVGGPLPKAETADEEPRIEHSPALGIHTPALDTSGRLYLKRLHARLQRSDKRPVEVLPNNVRHALHLGQLYPRSRFIHVIRDGRAICQALSNEKDPQDPVYYRDSIEGSASYWARTVYRARLQSERLTGRYLEVFHENLVSRPQEELKRILAFLGEPTEGLPETSGTMAQPVQWSPQVDRSVQENTGGLLRELGYVD